MQLPELTSRVRGALSQWLVAIASVLLYYNFAPATREELFCSRLTKLRSSVPTLWPNVQYHVCAGCLVGWRRKYCHTRQWKPRNGKASPSCESERQRFGAFNFCVRGRIVLMGKLWKVHLRKKRIAEKAVSSRSPSSPKQPKQPNIRCRSVKEL